MILTTNVETFPAFSALLYFNLGATKLNRYRAPQNSLIIIIARRLVHSTFFTTNFCVCRICDENVLPLLKTLPFSRP